MKQYDMKKPHKMVISRQGNLIIQNGIVYEYGSGRALGPVRDIVKVGSPGIIACPYSGATFPDTPDGKIALQEYQDRMKLLPKKHVPGDVELQEIPLAERKEKVMERREKINKKKAKE